MQYSSSTTNILLSHYGSICAGVEAGASPGHGERGGDEAGWADPSHRPIRLLSYQGLLFALITYMLLLVPVACNRSMNAMCDAFLHLAYSQVFC
jgi:hypothetical protein